MTSDRSPARRGLPATVYVLGLSLFAIGSSEFLIAGVLPRIATDLHVTLPTAGTLISAFAVGVLLGAPPLAVLTLRLPRRTTILLSQAVFVVATAVGMLAPGYWALLATRVVCGVAYAAFWAAASVTAVRVAPADRTARALSVVVTGLSLAMIAGGPVGTLIGAHAGWRAGFWTVAALTAATAVAVLLTLPADHGAGDDHTDVRTELRAMARPHLWIAYGTTTLTTAMYMAPFGYLGALLTDTSGLTDGWVPAVLSLFGIGAFAGLTIGGRTADGHPFRTLTAGIACLIGTSAALALLAAQPVIAIVLVFLLGVTGFVINPAVWGRVFAIAADAPTLAGATNVSAFQLGITLAPLAGGLVIGSGLAAVGWVGVVLGVLALGTTTLDARLHHRAPARERAGNAMV